MVIKQSNDFTKLKLKISNFIEVHINQLLNFNKNIKNNCFSFTTFTFNNITANAIAYLVNDNDENVKYYFVIDSNSYNNIIPEEEIRISNYSSISAINIYNILKTIKNDYNKILTPDFKKDLNKVAKNCFSIIKADKNMNIYKELHCTDFIALTPNNINIFLEFIILDINNISTKNRNVPVVNYNNKNTLNNSTSNYDIFDTQTYNNKYKIEYISDLDEISVNFNVNYLKIAINEIISNAFKFSTENINITLTLKSDKEFIYIECCDSGISFHKNIIDTAFEPFIKHLPPNFRHELCGVGLGLTVAKKIVELHNGDIYFSNNKDTGATVTIKLPYLEMSQLSNFSSYENTCEFNSESTLINFYNVLDLDFFLDCD